jgi:Skp family chaperone for outer membrane proteins
MMNRGLLLPAGRNLPALLLGLIISMIIALGPAPAQAQVVKIGYIDSIRIFESYSFARETQDRFGREIEAWRRESDDRLQAIEEQRAELKEQSLVLSEERRLELENQLQRSLTEYEQFVQAFWGPNGKAASMNQQLTAEVIQKVRDVVEQIALDEAYDLVLDAADGNVIFAVKTLDLTDRVLDILNEEAAASNIGGQP